MYKQDSDPYLFLTIIKLGFAFLTFSKLHLFLPLLPPPSPFSSSPFFFFFCTANVTFYSSSYSEMCFFMSNIYSGSFRMKSPFLYATGYLWQVLTLLNNFSFCICHVTLKKRKEKIRHTKNSGKPNQLGKKISKQTFWGTLPFVNFLLRCC